MSRYRAVVIGLFAVVVSTGQQSAPPIPQKAKARPKAESTEYVPPSQPRTEAAYGKLYEEIKECDSRAAHYADLLVPEIPPPENPSRNEQRSYLEKNGIRAEKWTIVYDKELTRLYRLIAIKERIPVEEVEDIRAEGDIRGWWVLPRKRDRFTKTETQIRDELKEMRAAMAEDRRREREKRIKAEAERVRIEADRPRSLFQQAQFLEKTNPKAAREYYQTIRTEYPGTSEASKAKQRLEAMEKGQSTKGAKAAAPR